MGIGNKNWLFVGILLAVAAYWANGVWEMHKAKPQITAQLNQNLESWRCTPLVIKYPIAVRSGELLTMAEHSIYMALGLVKKVTKVDSSGESLDVYDLSSLGAALYEEKQLKDESNMTFFCRAKSLKVKDILNVKHPSFFSGAKNIEVQYTLEEEGAYHEAAELTGEGKLFNTLKEADGKQLRVLTSSLTLNNQ